MAFLLIKEKNVFEQGCMLELNPRTSPAKRFLDGAMVVALVMALVLANQISKKTADHFHQGGIHTDLFYIF